MLGIIFLVIYLKNINSLHLLPSTVGMTLAVVALAAAASEVREGATTRTGQCWLPVGIPPPSPTSRSASASSTRRPASSTLSTRTSSASVDHSPGELRLHRRPLCPPPQPLARAPAQEREREFNQRKKERSGRERYDRWAREVFLLTGLLRWRHVCKLKSKRPKTVSWG